MHILPQNEHTQVAWLRLEIVSLGSLRDNAVILKMCFGLVAKSS